MIWDAGNLAIVESEGQTTNPGTTNVMADTGALDGGNYEVRALVGASAAATFALQRRNAANDGNVGDVPVLYVVAGSSAQFTLRYRVEAGERIRLMMHAALTGTAAAALNVEKMT